MIISVNRRNVAAHRRVASRRREASVWSSDTPQPSSERIDSIYSA
jgi:hypothetical protein